jgi:hypothetical protein
LLQASNNLTDIFNNKKKENEEEEKDATTSALCPSTSIWNF